MINVNDLANNSKPLVGNCSGVYFLFHDDELVYIGQSWNCLLRIAEHTRKDSDKVFNKWNYIPLDDERERLIFEAQLRAKYKPRFNKV